MYLVFFHLQGSGLRQQCRPGVGAGHQSCPRCGALLQTKKYRLAVADFLIIQFVYLGLKSLFEALWISS